MIIHVLQLTITHFKKLNVLMPSWGGKEEITSRVLSGTMGCVELVEHLNLCGSLHEVYFLSIMAPVWAFVASVGVYVTFSTCVVLLRK